MYTQRLENTHNALWESRVELIASRQMRAPAAESSIHPYIS